MKIWYRVTITFTMLLVIFALLITGFQLAVYGDSHYGFYKKEEKLSIVTDVDGEHQDFFNEQDRLHLADVRNLFLGGLKLRNYAVILATILMIVLRAKKADFRRLVPLGYLQALFVYLILAAILGVAMSIDFTSCFTLFHKLFFTNNLWIFDPETDYMIRMLPEGFFSDMVIRVGVIFIVLLAVPGVAAVVYNWKWKKERN